MGVFRVHILVDLLRLLGDDLLGEDVLDLALFLLLHGIVVVLDGLAHRHGVVRLLIFGDLGPDLAQPGRGQPGEVALGVDANVDIVVHVRGLSDHGDGVVLLLGSALLEEETHFCGMWLCVDIEVASGGRNCSKWLV